MPKFVNPCHSAVAKSVQSVGEAGRALEWPETLDACPCIAGQVLRVVCLSVFGEAGQPIVIQTWGVKMKKLLLSGAAVAMLPGLAFANCPGITVADMGGVAPGAFPQQYDLA